MVAGPSAPLPPPSTSHSLPAGLCSVSASWGLKWSPACWEAAGSRSIGPPRRRPRALAPLPPATSRLPQPRPPRGRDHLSVLSSRLLGYPFAPLLLPLLRHLPQALPFPASSHPSVYIVKAGRRTQTHTRPDTGAHTLTHDRQRRRRQQLRDSGDGSSHRCAPPSGGRRRGQTGESPHPRPPHGFLEAAAAIARTAPGGRGQRGGPAGAGTRGEAATRAASPGPAPAPSAAHWPAGPGPAGEAAQGGGAGAPKWVSGRHRRWHRAQRAARGGLSARASHRAAFGSVALPRPGKPGAFQAHRKMDSVDVSGGPGEPGGKLGFARSLWARLCDARPAPHPPGAG
ncbi:hypothetical protein ABFV05_020717 [Capra hircus]